MFEIHELAAACSGHIARRGLSAVCDSLSIDSRTVKPAQAFVCIKGNNFDGHDFMVQVAKAGCKCIIKNRKAAVPAAINKYNINIIEVDDTTKALGDIACYHRMRFNIPVIAVSGSNGKTTTKDMLAHILSSRYKVLKNEGTKNNHIGVPMSLLQLDASYQAAVIEIGSNHFGEIANLSAICRPNIGVITNIGPSHLEHFGSLQGVSREKLSMLNLLFDPRLAVINIDDQFLMKYHVKNKKIPVITYGSRVCDFQLTAIKRDSGGFTFRVNKSPLMVLKIPGEHNLHNALAAISCCRVLGLAYSDIKRKLADFCLPQGRLNVGKFMSAKLIDDTYNSNPLSLSEALKVLSAVVTLGRKVFVMGDMFELGASTDKFHSQAGKDAAKVCDVLVTVGKQALKAAKSCRATGFSAANIFSCSCAQEAKKILIQDVKIRKADVVLIKASRGMKLETIFK